MKKLLILVLILFSEISFSQTKVDYPTQIKRKPFIDVQEHGVDCSDTTDSTAALQALIDAAPNFSRIVFPNNCKVKISGSPAITIDSRYGLEFEFMGRQADGCDIEGPSASLDYAQSYSAGNKILYINRSQRLLFRNLTIYANGGADTGIDIDQVGVTPPINTQNDFYNLCVSNNATRNSSWTGVRISWNSLSNVEGQHFYTPNIRCSSQAPISSSSNGIGFDLGINTANTKNEIVENGSYYNCSVNTNDGAGSSNTITNGLSSSAWTDFVMAGFNDAITGYRSENAEHMISITNAIGPHLIEHDDFAAGVAEPIDCPSGCGITTLFSNETDGPSAPVNWFNTHSNNSGSLVAAGNRFFSYNTLDFGNGSFVIKPDSVLGAGAGANGVISTFPFWLTPVLSNAATEGSSSPGIVLENGSLDDFILQNVPDGGTNTTLLLGYKPFSSHNSWIALQGTLSGLTVGAIPDPGTNFTDLSTRGTPGSTSYSYKVVAHGATGTTLPSTVATITTGNATLSSTNYNFLQFRSVAGCTYFDVYRTASGGTPSSTGIIGKAPCYSLNPGATNASNGGSTRFLDTGLAGDSSSPPTINTTGSVSAPSGIFNGINIPSVALSTSSNIGVSSGIIEGTGGSNGITLTTQSASLTSGHIYTIKKVDSGVGTVTITDASAALFDGDSSYILSNQWQYVVLQWNGTRFNVIGNN